MISYLSGVLENKAEKYIILDVQGLGYKIFISPETFRKLPELGGKIKVYCRLYLREDTVELYGVLTSEELELFETFLAISGIGPRVALNLIALAPPKALRGAIAKNDINFLTRVSGLGRKRAEKIILELKDKLGKPEAESLEKDKEVLEALMNLGYSAKDSKEAIEKVPATIQSLENRTKEAFKILGSQFKK